MCVCVCVCGLCFKFQSFQSVCVLRVVFLCFCLLCGVCASCMRERRKDRVCVGGRWVGRKEGVCFASDGRERYFHMNHIGVGVAACAMSEFNVSVWCSL